MSAEADTLKRELRTTAGYPDFHGDHEAEIIWLQHQVALSQERLAFAEERLRIRADFWEAKQELSLLHASHAKRVAERSNDLERALAAALAHLPAAARKEAMLTLGLADKAFPAGHWSRPGTAKEGKL